MDTQSQMNYYTGIGSRTVPSDIRTLMTNIAEYKSKHGWCLRSGAAHGSDLAFQVGASIREIYLPWDYFNSFTHTMHGFYVVPNTKEADQLARDYHPNWDALSKASKQLMTRNVYQVLGWDLNTPSLEIICWTEDAATTTTSANTGGTGQALRIGIANGIPIYNLANEQTRQMWIDRCVG